MKPVWNHTAQTAHPPTRFLLVMMYSSGPNDPTTRQNTAIACRDTTIGGTAGPQNPRTGLQYLFMFLVNCLI